MPLFDPNHKRPVLVIAGPTASGKSSMAVDMAEAFNGVVINADSMQIYKELDVLTARPSLDELSRAPHRLYGVLDGDTVCSAGLWRDLALQEIRKAHQDKKLPILCGGTGLYIKALVEGFSDIPEVDETIRSQTREEMEEKGSEAMHQHLKSIDPAMAEKLRPSDPQRIARALEVIRSTGKSLDWWQKQPLTLPPDDLYFQTITLVPERSRLYERCNLRLDKMLEWGALEEVKELLAKDLDPTRPVMRALGVPEFAALLSGEMSKDEALTQAKTATRRYAKRQNTWINGHLITNFKINAQYSESLRQNIFAFIMEKGLTV